MELASSGSGVIASAVLATSIEFPLTSTVSRATAMELETVDDSLAWAPEEVVEEEPSSATASAEEVTDLTTTSSELEAPALAVDSDPESLGAINA